MFVGDPMNDLPQVVVRLGAHKTGTSLVQFFLTDRRRQLKRHGIACIHREDAKALFGWGNEI